MDMDLCAKVKLSEWAIQRYEFRYLRHELDSEKLYKGDPRLLMFISQVEGCSQTRIAKNLCIKPATLTVMIKRMEAAGLISRKADEKDMRTQRVYITERGKETAERTRDVFRKAVEDIYDGLTETELAEYLRIMEKIQKNLVKLTDSIPKEAFDFELPR